MWIEDVLRLIGILLFDQNEDIGRLQIVNDHNYVYCYS